MRRLMHKKVLAQSLPLGIIVSVLSIPYVCAVTPPGTLRHMRLAFMFPISVIMFQTAAAWTPLAEKRDMLIWPWSLKSCFAIPLAGLLVAIFQRLWVDPMLEAMVPGFLAESRRNALVSLPWVSLFQPLALVAGVYAFGARLLKSRTAAVAAVVVAHQVLVFLQLRAVAPGATLVLFVILAGMHAILLASVHRWQGILAVAVISAIAHCRFLF